MKLVLLGTTGYHPNNRRHTACFAVPEVGLVFDAGTGIFRLPEVLQTDQLDVFLSHAHLDHVVGLTFLLGLLWNRSMQRVTIHARQRDLRAIDEHLLSAELFPVKLPYEFRPLLGEGSSSAGPTHHRLFECELSVAGGGRLRHFPLTHPGGSVGYRVDWPGHSLAYITDTIADPQADYVQAIQSVDVLIHECYFRDDLAEWGRRTGHSWLTPVAQVAAAAQVGQLVLVHINPLWEEEDPLGLETARAIFPATLIGRDTQEIEF